MSIGNVVLPAGSGRAPMVSPSLEGRIRHDPARRVVKHVDGSTAGRRAAVVSYSPKESTLYTAGRPGWRARRRLL